MDIRIGDIVETVPHNAKNPEKALVMEVVGKKGKEELVLHFEFASGKAAWFESKNCRLLQRCPIQFKKKDERYENYY